jgi:hypothetical protein
MLTRYTTFSAIALPTKDGVESSGGFGNGR